MILLGSVLTKWSWNVGGYERGFGPLDGMRMIVVGKRFLIFLRLPSSADSRYLAGGGGT